MKIISDKKQNGAKLENYFLNYLTKIMIRILHKV